MISFSLAVIPRTPVTGAGVCSCPVPLVDVRIVNHLILQGVMILMDNSFWKVTGGTLPCQNMVLLSVLTALVRYAHNYYEHYNFAGTV